MTNVRFLTGRLLSASSILLSMAIVAPAQDDVAPITSEEPEVPVITEPIVPDPAQLNTTQMEKVRRLSEASGVSEDEILEMRQGTRTDSDLTETGEPDSDTPRGRGWGVIAKWLGLHPGVLGQGTGEKFYPPKEENDLISNTGNEENESLLGSRDKVRERLFKHERRRIDKVAKLDIKQNRRAEKTRRKDLVRDRTKKNQKEKFNRGKGNKGNKGK